MLENILWFREKKENQELKEQLRQGSCEAMSRFFIWMNRSRKNLFKLLKKMKN